MNNFNFLPGSLELDDAPNAHIISKIIQDTFKGSNGYFGYKYTSLGRPNDNEAPTFVVITKEHGILLIDVLEDSLINSEEGNSVDVWTYESGDRAYSRDYSMDLFLGEVESRLKNEPSFYSRKKRKLNIEISSLIIFPHNSQSEINDLIDIENSFSNMLGNDDLEKGIQEFQVSHSNSTIDDDVFDKIASLIDGTYIFEDKLIIKNEEELKTKNSLIEESLKRTFKQDLAQRTISMQIPDGPQRIRGLAGTGKTIVLCLKAAITHKRKENFKILYLFNTQSLYGHIFSHITKYFVSEAKRPPDFENKLHVMHAWGGKSREGLYSSLCSSLGLSTKTFGDVRHVNDPLGYIFQDLLTKAGDRLEEIYDLVLIDEAQDIPPSVFEVIYKITKKPKRIIWAYDDFQSLRNMKIKEPEDLFGKNEKGIANMPNSILNGEYLGGIKKDFILPNCYRTPRPVLLIAHAIAMGLYNKDKVMQPYDHRTDWQAIGYVLVKPDKDIIEEGDSVKLIRPLENSKNKLEKIIQENSYNPINLIKDKSFDSLESELNFISSKIQQLINDDGISPEEIIVVNINTRGAAKNESLALRIKLDKLGIRAITPGYVESSDMFKVEGSVTISTPFRAKGNESNIAFVFNAQQVVKDSTLIARNAFFVSLTRTRGWCYITGNGQSMDILSEELKLIKNDFPYLKFIRPSNDKILAVRKLMDSMDSELIKLHRSIDKLKDNPELLLQEIKKNADLLKYISDGLDNE